MRGGRGASLRGLTRIVHNPQRQQEVWLPQVSSPAQAAKAGWHIPRSPETHLLIGSQYDRGLLRLGVKRFQRVVPIAELELPFHSRLFLFLARKLICCHRLPQFPAHS